MPRGRSRKPTKYNFPRISCSENEQLSSSDSEDTLEIQEVQSTTRPTRLAKVRCVQKISEIISSERSCNLKSLRKHNQLQRITESNELREQRLEDLRQRASQRLADESTEQREKRLGDLRQRASERVSSERAEQREQRLEDLRQRASERVCNESSEQREERLRNVQLRASQRVSNETAKQRKQRLRDLRQRASERVSNENVEQREQRLEDLRRRALERVSSESVEQRERRLEDLRQRASERVSNENVEQREQRLKDLRKRASERVSNQSVEQREQRLEDLRQRALEREFNENAEQREQRLGDLRQRASQRVANETDKQHEYRLEEQRRRDTRRRRNLERNVLPTYKCAVSADLPYQNLGPFEVLCIHCGALHFPEERVSNRVNYNSFGDCCLHGRIVMEPPKFSNELVRLFLKRHPLSEEFHKRIRNINASFALASFNVDDDRTINSCGIYSFIACGQIYHKMNMTAHPTQNTEGNFERPRNGQLYFLDPDDAINERINLSFNFGISTSLMELVEHIIRAHNVYVQGYIMMREVEEKVNRQATAQGIAPPHVKLLFRMPEETDHRRFNVPSCNEVCAVFTLNSDQSFPDNEMIVHQRNKKIVSLKNIDKRVEPFIYPLLYPAGTDGYHIDLQLQTPYASRHHLTRLEMAQYRLSFRPELVKYLLNAVTTTEPDIRQIPFNALHFSGRLFQQYLVDTYIRVERDRIQWIKYNQNKILAEQYTGVTRFINELAEEKHATVGEKIILPSSFPGSTRYYTENFEDAMALVRRLGSPDYFITMTSNANWPEIKQALRIDLNDGTTLEQLPQNRPDIVARVAKLKFHEMIDDLDKKQIFGKIAAFVYTIEFQKRGLPHMHLLVIMTPDDKIHQTEELDDLISSEIPGYDDVELRELVIKWMIHNPCGTSNPNSTCMAKKNGRIKCRFSFPKSFQEVTSLVDDGKPNYRRRYDPKLDPQSSEFSHQHAVYRKDIKGHRITRDNRHVVPYNGYLLKKFNCHINVEYVGSILAVKYLYKYIYKGHDCASIKIVEEQRTLIYNEPNTYIEGRCVTPPEACWRLFSFEIQKKSHSVQRLNIHLPGQYRIANLDQAQEDLADIGQKSSTLEAYFTYNLKIKNQQHSNQLNGRSETVIYYYYWQMPEHFKWVGKSSEWVQRVRQLRIIGRIHNVNYISQPELYHLRLLLYHVKDATSFDDLRTVNDIRYDTYKQACLARGLTYDDQQWIEGLRESAQSKMPTAMRSLFTQILIFGSPENPKRLWETFKEHLAEDFIYAARQNGQSTEDAINCAYRIIAHKLNTEATEGRNFQYWVQTFGFEDIDNYENVVNRNILNMDESVALGDQMYHMLEEKQIEIVDTILQAVNDQNVETKCFFIDGPGGTGKTFIYKTLYHMLTGRNRNVQCMAFTGIASILLPNGQTSHKTFGLKVPITPESVSAIKPGSPKARKLAEIEVFLMDEAPMLPKYGLSNIDLLLRSISNPDLPFGGKVMVLGGDFRQCLPVQPRANKNELLDLSIKRCSLWSRFKMFTLEKNMRVDTEQQQFAEYLLKLGNGELPLNAMEEIELPQTIISNNDLIEEVFGNCFANENYEETKDRAILAPLNKDVDVINNNIIAKLPGEYKVYYSHDSIKDQPEGALEFTPEFLNSINISDLPPNELKLKKNTIIMLLRNLDISEGLCNGTRLIVTSLCNNIIKAKIVTGEQSGKEVHIPRITLDSTKGKLGCTMQRHQFPVRPAFAVTVHKAQGQTFEFVGVDLKTPVFMHGMLYVAFSRVKRPSTLKVLLPQENLRHARNIVWKEIIG